MATPQEKRFARLLLSRKILTREQLNECLEFQAGKLKTGSRLPLWDCAVLQNVIAQGTAEKLEDEAGDLNLDSLGGFALIRKIGQGGMGTVWLANGPEKQKLAVKVLPANLAKQRTFLTRFFREAQTCIKLDHKNIVRGVAANEDHGHYFFAMEYVVGSSVKEMIKKFGAMPIKQANDIILQVCEGLGYAHEHGIIHRDIKPDNIMVTRAGVTKLMDLGVARQEEGADLTALTQTGTAMGTPYYMAPEQGMDAKRADARSDVYSLGATWYHMVTGQVPFDGDSSLQVLQKQIKEPLRAPHTVRPEVPRGVSMVIERMMAKDPAARVQSTEAVATLIHERCMGERDVVKELGLEGAVDAGGLWEMMVEVGGKLSQRRMSLDEVRDRAKRGQIKKSTPTRRAGTSNEFQPARDFVELSKEFFRDYAVKGGRKRGEAPASRRKMHDLVANYDQAERSYRRKKVWKKWKPRLIGLAVVAALALAAWHFWPQIWELVAPLIGEAAGNSPPNAP